MQERFLARIFQQTATSQHDKNYYGFEANPQNLPNSGLPAEWWVCLCMFYATPFMSQIKLAEWADLVTQQGVYHERYIKDRVTELLHKPSSVLLRECNFITIANVAYLLLYGRMYHDQAIFGNRWIQLHHVYHELVKQAVKDTIVILVYMCLLLLLLLVVFFYFSQ